jgi:hypothetical protein
MTQRNDEARSDAEARIEDARSEAAAYVIQQQPTAANESDPAEEQIADAVHQAEGETDPARLEELARQAEAARDRLRGDLFNTDEGR